MMVSKPLLPPAGRTKWQCGPGALAPRSMLATLPRSAGCVSAKAVPAPNDRTRQAIPAQDAAITFLRMSASLVAWLGYLIYTRAALDDGSPVRVVGSLPAVVVGSRRPGRATRPRCAGARAVGCCRTRRAPSRRGPGRSANLRVRGRCVSGARYWQHHASPERMALTLRFRWSEAVSRVWAILGL